MIRIAALAMAVSSVAPIMASAQTRPQPRLPPDGSWAAVVSVCRIAGGTLCADRAAGGFEMLVETHLICNAPILKPEDVWKLLDEYFGAQPNRDLRPEGLQGVSSFVLKAALARYPCPAPRKPSIGSSKAIRPRSVRRSFKNPACPRAVGARPRSRNRNRCSARRYPRSACPPSRGATSNALSTAC
jgi:hypothetical protein